MPFDCEMVLEFLEERGNLISALNSGLSGLAVHSAMVSNAGGNLANLNTTGYKSSRVQVGTLGASSRGGGEVGRGAQVLAVSRNFSSGPLLSTGGDINLAIQGDGFFRVSRGGEDVYTRDGSFRLDQDRYLVDAQGNRLQPDLQLPQDAASIQVDRNGHLTALDAQGNIVASAAIPLFRFANPEGLQSLGENDFAPTGVSGPALEGAPGAVVQGALEGANVDPAREMVDLMLGQRGFAASLKVMQTADQMLGSILDIRA
jgi:flagellar basal-body rod protein FlgG